MTNVPHSSRWTTVTLIAMVGAALGAVFGFTRPPSWEAQSELAVGGARVAIVELPGYITASNALAAAWSRLLVASEVTDQISRETGVSPDEVRSAVRSSPIPDAPIIRVRAKASTKEAALRLSNASSSALLDYITRQETSNTTADNLLRQIEEVSKELDDAVRSQELAVNAIARELAREVPRERALDRAYADRGKAAARAGLLEARIQALRELYSREVRATASGFGAYQLVVAEVARHDKAQRGQIYGFAFGTGFGLFAAAFFSLRSLLRPQ